MRKLMIETLLDGVGLLPGTLPAQIVANKVLPPQCFSRKLTERALKQTLRNFFKDLEEVSRSRMSNELDGWKAFQLISGAMVTALAWFGSRSVQKIDHLEQTSVTREEHERSMALMREERRAMHEENKTHLDRIEQIIRENEARDSKTRHDIFGSVNAVSLKITALAAVANERERKRDRGESQS